MFLDRSDLDAMMLFNDKAEKLNDNNFTKKITSEGFGVSFHAKKDEPVVVEKRLPIDEEIESFVLTIRLFIQDNEACSIRNLANKTYSKLPDYRKEKTDFIEARDKLNLYLDSTDDSLSITDNGEILKRREIFDTIVYGGLAHANDEKKRKKYKEWMGHPILGPIYEGEFVLILSTILSFLLLFQEMNESLINDYDNCFKSGTI